MYENELFNRHCKSAGLEPYSVPFGLVFKDSKNYQTQILPSLIYMTTMLRSPFVFVVVLQDIKEELCFVFNCGRECEEYLAISEDHPYYDMTRKDGVYPTFE